MQLIGSDVLNWDKKRKVDFPGDSVVKNLPASAGDVGSSSALEKIPHAEGWKSLWAAAAVPECPQVCALQQEKPLQWEACDCKEE